MRWFRSRTARRAFRDDWNPTAAEIRAWAYSDAYAPDQDWELALGDHPTLLVELVDDPGVPAGKRNFFLRALYVLVGDSVVRLTKAGELSFLEGGPVQGWFKKVDEETAHRMAEEEIASLMPILEATSGRCEPLQRWADRSRRLIEGETAHTYEDWGLDSHLAASERPWFEANSERP